MPTTRQAEQADQGVGQYVILGAGLDTFAQLPLEGRRGPLKVGVLLLRIVPDVLLNP